ncbi:TerD family protein [Kineococcus rhizosphaerae]|uniref:Tellurium resistance protein TerZ n=1 Tax=Kineococcus rhizosphaerae TaxID=559628 RepID=A0A2T0R8G4_9ACTN|nr:TerD family protein [Kineococcus rhizosphaerae]PRY17404.1 tellurium resistance protein TerZ [Kineococcus rhizosphaerae]
MAVSLTKGQKLSLSKTGGGELTRVFMGLGWDAVARGLFRKKSVDIDLDASVLLFDASRKLVDEVWFQQLRSKDGSVTHTGDNLTGEGDGDDEVIHIDLPAVPANVASLVFTVSSFTGQNFSQVQNAVCRLVDAGQPAEVELARYELSDAGPHTAQIMAKLTREGSGWAMTAIGAPAQGRHIRDLRDAVAAHL